MSGQAKADFVFREKPDGSLELVGDFDGLYREEDDPWGQSGGDERMGDYYAYSRANLADVLRRRCPSGAILEVGCGIGYVVDHLTRALPDASVAGLDISEVAIGHARRRFPQFEFHQGDVSSPAFRPPRLYDAVILNQLLWYILAKLDVALTNCDRMLKPDGLLVISQSFLKGKQRYGAEFADGFHGLLDRLLATQAHRYRLLEACYDDSGRYVHHDGLLVFRKCEVSGAGR